MSQIDAVSSSVEPTNLVQSDETEDQLRHWKHNFAANFVDVSFFSLGMAFASLTTIVPLFIRQLGGSTLLVGIVPAIVQTGWLLPPLFVAPYISRLNRKLPYILRMTLGERVPWFLLVLLTFFFARDYPTVVLILSIVLLAVFGVAGGLTMPAWMDMVAKVTPLRMRGRLFGWSGALGGLMGIGGGLLAERALDWYTFPLNFALCFLGAALGMAISFFALCLLREPAGGKPADALPVREYIRRLPIMLRADRDFTLFLISRALIVLGNMAVAFVAIYAAEERGLPESLAGRFTAWMLGTQVITTPIWGMIGDRRGHKSALQFGVLCNALATVLALFVTSAPGFYVIFGLLGASSGIFFATTLNMVVEFATPAERVTYIGLHGTLIAPATMLAPVIGGWLAEYAGYNPLFVVATICSLAGFILLTWWIRDPRHRQLALAQGQPPTGTA